MSERALDPQFVGAILELLRVHQHVDLRDHRRDVIERRLLVHLSRLGHPARDAYLARLAEAPLERTALLSTLVIPVTAFFRDPEVFAALEQRVLPQLMGSGECPLFRAWVVGAATGEEAWTLAMQLVLLAEPRGLEVQVLATDADPAVLAVARSARYAENSAARIPEHHRARFIRSEPGVCVVTGELRSRVQLVQHDLVGPSLAPREAIIASFELVLLRNVLIYFTPNLQAKAAQRAASIVRPGGVLVLGPAEMLPAAAAQHFEPYPGLPRRLGIYQRRTLRP